MPETPSEHFVADLNLIRCRPDSDPKRGISGLNQVREEAFGGGRAWPCRSQVVSTAGTVSFLEVAEIISNSQQYGMPEFRSAFFIGFTGGLGPSLGPVYIVWQKSRQKMA